MRAVAIAAALILLAGSHALAQGTQESPRTALMLEVAARGYLVGGRMGSMAGDSAVDRLESYVWADQSLCGMGAGDDAPTNTPWTGWHFTGTVLVDAPGEMTVRVEWRRMWENGARVQNGPSGSETYKLRNGERVELDRVVPATTGKCGTVEAKLEAAVLPRAPYLLGYRGGAGGGGTFGGVSTGTGSGTGTGTGAGTARGRVGTGAGTTFGGKAAQVAVWRRLGIVGAYDAEIWLVHKKPDGTESVQQQSVRINRTPMQFSFPQVQLAGNAGPILVDITGSLQFLNGPLENGYWIGLRDRLGLGDYAAMAPKAGAARTPLLIVSIARRARRTTPFLDTKGTTDVSMEIPKPDDVLSFELPPLQKSAEDLLKGHTFSIRVRMTPVK